MPKLFSGFILARHADRSVESFSLRATSNGINCIHARKATLPLHFSHLPHHFSGCWWTMTSTKLVFRGLDLFWPSKMRLLQFFGWHVSSSGYVRRRVMCFFCHRAAASRCCRMRWQTGRARLPMPRRQPSVPGVQHRFSTLLLSTGWTLIATGDRMNRQVTFSQSAYVGYKTGYLPACIDHSALWTKCLAFFGVSSHFHWTFKTDTLSNLATNL